MVRLLFVYSVSQIEYLGMLKSELEESCRIMESFTSMKGACLLPMCRCANQSSLMKIYLIANVDWSGQSIITKISCHLKMIIFMNFMFAVTVGEQGENTVSSKLLLT